MANEHGKESVVISEKKQGRLVELFRDKKKLVRASATILRRKRSPGARRIASGNQAQILRSARDKLAGGLGSVKNSFCREACRLIREGKKSVELLVALVSTLVSFVGWLYGLIISLIWLYKENMLLTFCKCSA